MKRRTFIVGTIAASLATCIGSIGAAAEKFKISRAGGQKGPPKFRKKTVRYSGDYSVGTIVVDTRNKFLYLVQPGGKAIRYGIGVGRQGFSWSGTAVIKRKAKWPTWTPPAAMVARDDFAAQWAGGMPGGPKNPLGARALYLYQGNVDTLYRIHGTFAPSSIGKAVSSGCIRMINSDVADLYDRIPVGTKVVVVQGRKISAEEDDIEPPMKRKRRFLFSSSDEE